VLPAGWLFTSGNHIYVSDGGGGGSIFRGRGANLQDTRGCGACVVEPSNPGEVERRADELIDNWHANFIRLTLESRPEYNRLGVREDPAYLAEIVEIVNHITAKPGVYVLVSLWFDQTFDALGRPTAATREEWRVLATALKNQPRALFGICNEPEYNFDGAQDATVWQAMNDTVQVIRNVENSAGTPHHVITVQGTGDWARRLDYYVTHPITAGGGSNIAYETHFYNPAAELDTLIGGPAKTLPVIIGEFGPINEPGSPVATDADVQATINFAKAHDIPHLAWTFHQFCPPNLIVDLSKNTCGIGMPLQPTAWGSLLKTRLAEQW
jgi:endoglucanase